MNYNPQTQYRGDQWIMQGGQQMAQIAQQLVGYFIDQGRQKQALQAQAETLLGDNGQPTAAPAGGAPAGSEGDLSLAGGFNPTTGGPTPASTDDQGPSPAAQRGMQADAMRKLIQTYAPEQKDLHQAIKGMSVGELEGMLKGYAMKQAASEHAAKMEDYNAQAALRRQQVMDDQTVGRLVSAYGTFDPGGEAPPTAEERMRYAFTKVPEAGGRVLPKAIEALTKYEQLLNPKAAEDLTARYTEDPVTGARNITYGKQLQSTGYNPAKAGMQAQPMHDDDGNLIGWGMTDVRGRSTFKGFHGNAKFAPATDTQGNPIPGFYVDPNTGKPIDARTTIQKLSGGEKSPAPATYKNKDDVVADYKAGKLSRDEAAKILNQKFNVKM